MCTAPGPRSGLFGDQDGRPGAELKKLAVRQILSVPTMTRFSFEGCRHMCEMRDAFVRPNAPGPRSGLFGHQDGRPGTELKKLAVRHILSVPTMTRFSFEGCRHMCEMRDSQLFQ